MVTMLANLTTGDPNWAELGTFIAVAVLAFLAVFRR